MSSARGTLEEIPAESETEYQVVSKLAVAGLVIGLVSSVVLFSTIFWPLPFAGVVISLIAMVVIRRNIPLLTGHSVAMWGLLLSLMFGAWAPARHFSRTKVLRDDAVQFATRWLELLQDGKTHVAHQLSLPVSSRAAVDEPLEPYYQRDSHLRSTLAGFVQNSPIKDVVQHGRAGQVTFERCLFFESKSGHDTVALLFSHVAAGKADPDPMHFEVVMHRDSPQGIGQHWKVAEWRVLRDSR